MSPVGWVICKLYIYILALWKRQTSNISSINLLERINWFVHRQWDAKQSIFMDWIKDLIENSQHVTMTDTWRGYNSQNIGIITISNMSIFVWLNQYIITIIAYLKKSGKNCRMNQSKEYIRIKAAERMSSNSLNNSWNEILCFYFHY